MNMGWIKFSIEIIDLIEDTLLLLFFFSILFIELEL